MDKNLINIYYKGVKQTIKYYGNFDEKTIKNTIKQIFKIQEPLEQIYFQDEDGDILALNEQSPSGISAYIFVESSAIPKNPSTELQLQESNQKLLKFHWIPQSINDLSLNTNLISIVNNYLYTTFNNNIHLPARSSCTFETGRHFCILRKGNLGYYSIIAVADEKKNDCKFDENIVGLYFQEDNDNIFTEDLGILIDMDKKKIIFYDCDRRRRKKILYRKNGQKEQDYEAPIFFDKAKIFVWIKSNYFNKESEGITILNGGCIPIPYWIKND